MPHQQTSGSKGVKSSVVYGALKGHQTSILYPWDNNHKYIGITGFGTVIGDINLMQWNISCSFINFVANYNGIMGVACTDTFTFLSINFTKENFFRKCKSISNLQVFKSAWYLIQSQNMNIHASSLSLHFCTAWLEKCWTGIMKRIHPSLLLSVA